jgi:hypothetical protein
MDVFLVRRRTLEKWRALSFCHSDERRSCEEESGLLGAPHDEILHSLRSFRMTAWGAARYKLGLPLCGDGRNRRATVAGG